MILPDIELHFGVAVFGQLFAGELDADPEALDKPECLEHLGKMRVTIVSDAGLSEVLAGDLAEGTTGILYLNAVIEPGHPHGSIRRLVVAV